MPVEQCLLVDLDPKLAEAWKEAFRGEDRVEVHAGDYFTRPCDAMVSPANSFGIMDGGLDAAIRNAIGLHIERRAQKMIRERYHGEMPVGSAEVVETGNSKWPWLVVAPTMRIPENVSHTLHAYHAFRAVLLAVYRFNDRADTPIRSLLVPGLCTGYGVMPPRRCAGQMRAAWNQVSRPVRAPNFREIHQIHRTLREL